MAKNISLLGADYPDVPAVQLPQTGGGTAVFYDIQVIDNLTSTSTTDALSANQGKVLNDKIDDLKKTGFGSPVALTHEAYYTCPSDGYIVITADGGTYGSLSVLMGSAMVMIGLSYTAAKIPIYVRKGMTIQYNGNGSGTFYPFA